MELAIILLIICNLTIFIAMGSLLNHFYQLCVNLKKEIKLANKAKENLISINVGDKAIYPNFELKYTEQKEFFKVTYEVEILEVSIDRVKVNALSYTTDNKKANESCNKQGVIGWMQNKWVSKNNIEIIVDDSRRRDSLLTEILDNK